MGQNQSMNENKESILKERLKEESGKRKDLEERVKQLGVAKYMAELKKNDFQLELQEKRQEFQTQLKLIERQTRAKHDENERQRQETNTEVSDLSEKIKQVEDMMRLYALDKKQQIEENEKLQKEIEERKQEEKSLKQRLDEEREEWLKKVRKNEEELRKAEEEKKKQRKLDAERKRAEEERKKRETAQKPARTQQYGRYLYAKTTQRQPPKPKEAPKPAPRDVGLKWDETEAAELRDGILETRKDSGGNEVDVNILVFGPTGHGKSTFCNGLSVALENARYVPQYFVSGSSKESFTKNFMRKYIRKLCIVDMCGLYNDQDVTTDNLRAILSGQVPFQSKLNGLFQVLQTKSDEKEGATAPSIEIPMIIIVLRHEELSVELKRQLSVVNELAGEGVLSRHLVITHLDVKEPELNNTRNLTKLYSYEKVQQALKNMSEETGIPENAIHVVRNYVTQQKPDLYTNLVYLRFLDMVMADVDGQIEKNRLRSN